MSYPPAGPLGNAPIVRRTGESRPLLCQHDCLATWRPLRCRASAGEPAEGFVEEKLAQAPRWRRVRLFSWIRNPAIPAGLIRAG